MDPKLLSTIGAAGAAGDSVIGVEDVFKTYVYTGNASDKTITNNINFDEGGLVWIKRRDGASDHALVDTERGASQYISSNSTAANVATGANNNFNSFTSTGFTLKDDNGNDFFNKNNADYCSWSFRKQKKFFTICTWTGNGTQNHEISHDLNSVPGAIFIKKIAAPSGGSLSDSDWFVYHRSMDSSNPEQYGVTLNYNNAIGGARFSVQGDLNYYAPTSAHFKLGSGSRTNESGATFVAYLFAHEEAEFGPNSDQKIISCSSYTGNGSSTGPTVTLPFEPGFLLIKGVGDEYWRMFDNMRGIVSGGNEAILYPPLNSDEHAIDYIELTSTGFKVVSDNSAVNTNTSTYIYIAIAAETGKTMKAIETASDVFAMAVGNGSSTIPAFTSGFPVDFGLWRKPAAAQDWLTAARLIQGKYLKTNDTAAEAADGGSSFDSNTGLNTTYGRTDVYQAWQWKRSAGFDVVCWEGQNIQPGVIPHSLGKIPEMMWVRKRSGGDWEVYHKGLNGGSSPETYSIKLNESDAEVNFSRWYSTAPTSTHFTVTKNNFNQSNENYIALLFSSVKGISHCGTFTGNGSTQTITIPNGGFQPRFLIMKCTSHAVDWQVLDTTRGWASGNDPYMELNTNAAQYTTNNFGEPTSTGFTLNENAGFNGSGRSYIYYAHA